MRMRLVFLNIALALFFATSLVQTHASETPQFPTNNLEDMTAADTFAKELVARLKAEAAANPSAAKDPLLIMHVGNDLPQQLKWVIVHLERAHVPFEIELVEKHEVDAALADARDNAPGATALLNYGEGQMGVDGTRAVRSVWQNANLMARRLFAMPNGYTMWIKMNRTMRQRIAEGFSSVVQGGIAGLSLGFSLYLAKSGGVTVSIAPAVAVMITWVAVNGYWGRQLAEWQGQGRSVTEPQPGQFKVKKGQAFFLLTAAIRSSMTNALIVGSAFGLEKLTTAQGVATNIENTAVNIVARSWIDQWSNSHQATTLPDGSIVVKAGQWSPNKTIVINTVWNVFYGLLKNLHLLNFGAAAKWTYVVMGVVGVSKMAYDERHWFKHKWEHLGALIRGAARTQCETLLVRKSAVNLTSSSQ